MPRELTHLTVSGEALKRVEAQDPCAGRALRDNHGIFMFGSILCDSPYYEPPIHGIKKGISFLSEKIHTPGGDIDGDFFDSLASSPPPEARDAYFAFLCGILSHHFADRGLHPMIVYFTGDYKDPDLKRRKWSQARHRFLEGLIDIWVAKQIMNKDIHRFRLNAYIPFEFPVLSPYISSFVYAIVQDGEGADIPRLSRRLFRALGFENRLVGLYVRSWFRQLLLRANRLAGYRFSKFAALCYADEKRLSIPIFSETMTSLNPFTGDKVEKSISTLINEIIDALANAIVQGYEGFSSSGRFYVGEETFPRLDAAFRGIPRYFDTSDMERVLEDFLAS